MKSEIPGVAIKDLKVHFDDRGCLWELLRCDDLQYLQFGQAYISTIMPGVVKGFHAHERQYDNVAVVYGKIKLVLMHKWETGPRILPMKGDSFDIIEEYVLVPGNYLITIPPGVYHGWKNIGTEQAYVVNTPSEPHSQAKPDELRIDPHEWYDWSTTDK